MPKLSRSGAPLALSLFTLMLIAAATIAPMTRGAGAKTSTPISLIELYTSQGCNSCPPANALLKKYIARKDVIAISLPVDYWDYLGWKDTFGKRQFSNRQRQYARTRGDGQVYTPQIVAGGTTHAVGSQPRDVDNAIKQSRSTNANHQIPLSLTLKGKKLTISSPDNGAKNATIWLALISRKVTELVPRGENRGRKITYYNLVRDLKSVGAWTGKPLTITLPDNHGKSGRTNGCVVFLQEGSGGAIIAAAEL